MTGPQRQLVPPTSAYRKSLWFPLAGLLSVVVSTVILRPTGLLERIPGIGPLFSGKGLVGVVAFLIFVAALWVLVYVILRLLTFRKERAAVFRARIALGSARSADGLRYLASDTVIGQRLQLFGDPATADAGAVLAAHSEIDHARSEVSYLPARALVWALPALGFIGTAATMSNAIGGLANQDLNANLKGSVIEPLAGAFDITLFALGAAVVCHLLLTWTTAREQRLLLFVEEVVLDVFRAFARPTPAAAPPPIGPIGELTDELRNAHRSLGMATQAASALDLSQLDNLSQFTELVPLLRSVDEKLDRIHGELAQDFVITKNRLHVNGR